MTLIISLLWISLISFDYFTPLDLAYLFVVYIAINMSPRYGFFMISIRS